MCDKETKQKNAPKTAEFVTKQQQERVNDSEYSVNKIDARTYYEQSRQVSDTTHNYLQNNVRTAIVDRLGQEKYRVFDDLKIKKSGDEPHEKVALHHSVGSKYALNGEDVIEFNISGTGFNYPRMDHKDMTGREDAEDYMEKDIEVSWYNRFKPFTWLPKIRTKNQIEALNANRKATNRKLDEVYGEKVNDKVAGKKLGHLRKKESVNDKNATKTRFYLKGPNAADIGKYSEAHLEEYIFELGRSTLENKLNRLERFNNEKIAEEKPLHVMLQGQGRGGVAAVLGAMRLKRWIADNHPRLLGKVQFDLIQYDPTIGDLENFGKNKEIDHNPSDPELSKNDSRYMSLGEEANTTVVYSMHADHKHAQPQKVKNPKRIILTTSDQNMNLDQIDTSQVGKITRATYLAEKNGRVEAFRSSGLSELDEGVYICDDQNNLIRIKSAEEFDAIAKPLLKGGHLQQDRHKVVREMVKTWFKSNAEAGVEEDRKEIDKEGKAKEKKAEAEAGNAEADVIELKTKDLVVKDGIMYPRELEGAIKEAGLLEGMSRNTKEEQAEYLKRQKKYITAKRSGLKAYLNRLNEQKGGFIDNARKEYLDMIVDLSYYKEKEAYGIPDDKLQEKTDKLINKIRVNPLYHSANTFMPECLSRMLYVSTDEQIAKLVYPPEEKPATWDNDIKTLFVDLCGVIKDDRTTKSKNEKAPDGIWSRIHIMYEDDSPAFRQFRGAVSNIMKLVEKSNSKVEERRPDAAAIMQAMAVLSETANAYYDSHRGHKWSDKGEKRREACDMVRQITREFYDRLDIAMGRKGYGNLVEKKKPEKTSSSQRSASAYKMDELVGVYKKWKKHFAYQEGLERAKIRDRAILFEPYMPFIDMYRDTHKVTEWSKEIEEVIRDAAFYRVQRRVHETFEEEKGGMKDPLLELTKEHVKKIKGKTSPGAELDPKTVDKDLSDNQLKGLALVDQWFLRNYNNSGLGGSLINVRNHHGELVSELLGKTKRERLFIYYLIETGKRKNPGVFDLFASQAYTPNLEKFKDRMLASKFKIMSHIMGSYVYMGKVTEALQVNDDYRRLLKDCAEVDMGVNEVKGKELEELKKNKDAYRSYALVKTAGSAKAFRNEAIRVEELGKKATEQDKKSLNDHQQAFLKDLKELLRADEEVGEAIKYGEGFGKVTEDDKGKLNLEKNDKYYSVKNTNPQDLIDNAGTYVSAASGLAGNVHLPVNAAIFYGAAVDHLIDVSKGKDYNPTFWKLGSYKDLFMQPSTYASTVTAATITCLGSFLGACYGVYNLTAHWSDKHGGDRAAEIARVITSAGSVAQTVLQTMDTAKDIAKQAAPVTSKLTKGIGFGVAGLKTATEFYTVISGHLDIKNANNASKKLQGKIYNRYLATYNLDKKEKTKEEQAQTEKEYRQARYERNMMRLARKLGERKRKYAAYQTAVGVFSVAGGGITATIAGGVVGALGTTELTAIRNDMFDRYFELNEFMDDALEDMRKRGQEIRDEKNFKIRMRRVVAAAAGYSDLISACDQIAKIYADQICKGLFGDDEDRVEGDIREGYIQIVKSFGLPYDEAKKIPSADLLARKMNGK